MRFEGDRGGPQDADIRSEGGGEDGNRFHRDQLDTATHLSTQAVEQEVSRLGHAAPDHHALGGQDRHNRRDAQAEIPHGFIPHLGSEGIPLLRLPDHIDRGEVPRRTQAARPFHR